MTLIKKLKKANKYAYKKLGVKISRSRGGVFPVHIHHKNVHTGNKSLSELDVDTYLQQLNEVFLSSVKNIDFISTTKKPSPLIIDIDSSVKSIKLSIPTAQNFHLHSIELLGKSGKPIKPSTNTKVTISSQFDQYDSMTDSEHKKHLFTPMGRHAYAFYTESVKNSWVKITFPKNINISSIKINNIKKHVDPRENAAQKALGLQVRTSSNGDRFDLVYDMGGIKNFNKAALKLARENDLSRYKHGRVLLDFTVAVLQCRKLKSKQLYNNIPLEYRKTISKALNENILYARNMEWTSHGIRRSFRFWSKAEKQEYVVEATKLMHLLKDLSPDVSLAFGSVLAVVRDKDFMPHDDDIDTWIAFKKSQISTYVEGFELIRKHIEPHGYTIRENKFNLSKIGIGNCKIDVFISIYDDDGTLGLYPCARHVLKRSDIFPAQEITFLGEKTYLPKDPEKYLAYTYGPNWRTPDPNFKYKRDKSIYADIAK